MKYFRKTIIIVTVLVIIGMLMIRANENTISISTKAFIEGPVEVGVLISSFDGPYEAAIMSNLKHIEEENKEMVKYNFYNGKRDQNIQNSELDKLLEENKVRLILLNLVNPEQAQYAIDRIKENNIPVILFGGVNLQTIRTYSKAYWIGTNTIEGGILQGEVITSLWNNIGNIDRNKDNILQYVMLKGAVNDMYTIERSRYSILTVVRSGIRTQELATRVCNWSEEEAKVATETLLLRFGNTIEMIIANNDSMAIGAIKALQESGYNLGDGRITIPVVGFDGTAEALDLIERGIMSGTVIQDPKDYAEAFYTVGMNLVNNRNPVEGTDYEFNEVEGVVTLKYKGVMLNVE